MSPFSLDLEKTTGTELVFLEPALNAFGSMLLVSKAEDDLGIHDWVRNTRRKMSAEEQFRHKLVTIGFHYSILPTIPGISFEAYLSNLEAASPPQLRERLLDAYSKMCLTEESLKERGERVDWQKVLASAEAYVGFLRYRFGEELVDEDMESRAYRYVLDPPALKELVTGHIRWFWNTHLKAEWNRSRPLLEKAARAFNQFDLGDMARPDLVRFVTGHDFKESKWMGDLESSAEVIFVPNPHIGPYIRSTKIGVRLYIYFGARLPEGSEIQAPELERAEIASKLGALADETRLQILRLIAENGEMRSSELMEATRLSQPSVSRYLGQLTANGFLQERRVNGAKAYTVNFDRIENTLKAVSAFLIDRTKEKV
jgi:ArsR family transcriptional regulator